MSVPAGFPASFGCGHIEPEELVGASFKFLLEREPATSILHEFSLDLISRCFPGYQVEICACLRGDPGAPPLDPPPPPAGKISPASPKRRLAGSAVARGELAGRE